MSVKDRGDEITTLSDARFVPKCLIKNVVPCKSQKLGHYVEMTRQNMQVFLHAPFYKYQCDITMTCVETCGPSDMSEQIKRHLCATLNDKKDLQKLRYGNDCFEPYSPNSHFVTVNVTAENSHTNNAENIIINSMKAAAHLESRKSDLAKVIYDE